MHSPLSTYKRHFSQQKAVAELIKRQGPQDIEMGEDGLGGGIVATPRTPEERYMDEMKKMQFGKRK